MKPAPQNKARLYGGKWQRESQAFLARPENRLCACGCGQPATVVDHRIPHRGDLKLFWSRSNWQPLAKVCHDRDKQREERIGYNTKVGIDGLPSDPRHPFNR